MILEVYLNDLIAQPKHNRVPSPHPLLHINNVSQCLLALVCRSLLLIFPFLGLGISFEVASEVLQQSDLLLKLFRVVGESVRLNHVLSFWSLSFHVVEVMTLFVQHYFG